MTFCLFNLDNLINYMALTLEDVNKLAQLARLSLKPDEINNMQNQLNHFFEMVEQISSVDTVNVLPLDHPTALHTPHKMHLRPDVVSEKTNRQLNQKSAPLAKNGLYLVPRVLD